MISSKKIYDENHFTSKQTENERRLLLLHTIKPLGPSHSILSTVKPMTPLPSPSDTSPPSDPCPCTHVFYFGLTPITFYPNTRIHYTPFLLFRLFFLFPLLIKSLRRLQALHTHSVLQFKPFTSDVFFFFTSLVLQLPPSARLRLLPHFPL
jgi:hypothetical protein